MYGKVYIQSLPEYEEKIVKNLRKGISIRTPLEPVLEKLIFWVFLRK